MMSRDVLLAVLCRAINVAFANVRLANGASAHLYAGRAPQLKIELSQVPHVIGRRSSLPADKIETLVQAETSVDQTKAANGTARRPRLSRPFDMEPSGGHTETRRSGAVVLECRPQPHFFTTYFAASISETLGIFGGVLNHHTSVRTG